MVLYQTLKEKAFDLGLTKPHPKDYAYITDNLRYPLFEWQRTALENFLLNEQIRKQKGEADTPNHLMFNMATGSGKTLLMAALLLYYYKQGYRNFIFFVNQTVIVGKTQENFIQKSHPKYLFSDTIHIDGQVVNIRGVDVFSSYTDDLQIKFTSIQKLHNEIYKEGENALILSDLQRRDIVLMGDEAHHLNSLTRANVLSDAFEKELTDRSAAGDVERSWEATVSWHLLYKGWKGQEKEQQHGNRNVLLEFTATIPADEAIRKKYEDKLIAKFDLKDFVLKKGTKELNLISSSYDVRKRILQALLFNWYRHRIALKYGIENFKPVMLFRSRTIEESNQAYTDFLKLIKELQPQDFCFVDEPIVKADLFDGEETYRRGASRLIDIRRFIREEGISKQEIVEYLQDNFTGRNVLVTNSKSNKTKTEKTDEDINRLLNSLEERTNPIRGIFTVQRLTEGWDVKNLYDIVRLYNGRDETTTKTGARKSGSNTTSEIQLIGRGVRYFPFPVNGVTGNRRRFDDDLTNELRVLEEFYFHSENEHRYISELIRGLKEKGIVTDRRKNYRFSIKPDVKKDLENTLLFVNERIENPNRKRAEFPSDNWSFVYRLDSDTVEESKPDFESESDEREIRMVTTTDSTTITRAFSQFERHIAYKAWRVATMKADSLLKFDHLRQRFRVQGMKEFFGQYLGNLSISIVCGKETSSLHQISNKDKLKILIRFFQKVEAEIDVFDQPYVGSKFHLKRLSDCFPDTKEKLIDENKEGREENLRLAQDLKEKEWYALDNFWGTSEERSLIELIKGYIGNLNSSYDHVTLLRNEEVYKIYNDRGEAFEPDFLLLLNKLDGRKLYMQVFIEPKGDGLLEKDAWKERFLADITARYGMKHVVVESNNDYVLIGLPFYNANHKKEEFTREFEQTLGFL